MPKDPRQKPAQSSEEAAQAEADRIAAETARARELLIQLKNQVTAMEKRRDGLQVDAERLTERLKSEQAAKLQAQVDEYAPRLAAAKTACEGAEADLLRVKGELSARDGRLTGLDEEIRVRSNALARFTEEEAIVEGRITSSRGTLSGLQEQVISLQGQLPPLQQELERLTEAGAGQAQTSKDEIAALTADIGRLTTEQATLRRDISALDSRKRELGTDLMGERTEMDRARQELAMERRRLDAADKNLRIREAKVAQAEGRIAENANLLNL